MSGEPVAMLYRSDSISLKIGATIPRIEGTNGPEQSATLCVPFRIMTRFAFRTCVTDGVLLIVGAIRTSVCSLPVLLLPALTTFFRPGGSNPAMAGQQDSGLPQAGERQPKIEMHAALSQDKVHPGSDVLVAFVLTVRKGWHINSARPSDETMIPTAIEAAKAKEFTLGNIRYPEGVQKKFGFSDSRLDVYEGTITIFGTIHVQADVKAGTYALPTDVSYQACNDVLCLAPTRMRVSVPIEVVPAGEPVRRINKDLFKGASAR